MRSFKAIRDDVSVVCRSLEAGCLSGEAAAAELEAIASIKRLLVGAELALAGRVKQTEVWRADGSATPGEWWARRNGTSKADGQRVIDTAAKVATQPELAEAIGHGALSERQAAAIAAVGEVVPEAVGELVDKAGRVSLRELTEDCDRRRAAADRDAEARRARIHAARALRHWIGADGLCNLWWSGAPEVGAELLARLAPFRRAVFDQARRDGRRERPEAYDADALVAMARTASAASEATSASPPPDGDPSTPTEPDGPQESKRKRKPKRTGRPAKVIARVDWSAVRRGHLHHGELCEIAGIGPVAPSVIRELIDSGDSLLAAVLTDGIEVQKVVHAGRKLTAAQRTAMEWRDPQCIVLGCDRRLRLEIDHRADYAITHHTTLDELDYHCEPHHDLKTYQGWQLEPGTGKRRLLPPDHPDHPGDPRGTPPPGRRRRAA